MAMKAMTHGILLAAGFGTRLKPLTDKTPKPLLPLNGKNSLEWGVGFFRQHGIHHIAVNLHHHGSAIEKSLGDGARFGIHIKYSHEEKILGTGGGIKQAAHILGGTVFVVLNSVVLIDCDLAAVMKHHHTQQADATMVLRPFHKGDNFTPVDVDSKGWVKSFGKGKYFYTGLQIIGNKLLETLPPVGTAACLIQDGYVPLLQQGGTIAAVIHDGYWNKLETLERYEAIKRDIASGTFSL